MFVIIMLTMLAYAIFHSWLASTRLKLYFQHRAGDRRTFGWYRTIYNVIAIVTLSPIFGLIVFRPGNTVWQVTGVLQGGFVFIQLAGLIGMGVALLQINLGQFMGLSQMMAYLQGQPLPLPLEPLQFGGVYRLVRHPLYLFSLMVIWPMSTMSESLLAFNVCSTIYFVVGSMFEERKLAATYGDSYRQYQRQTPSIIPFLKGFPEL